MTEVNQVDVPKILRTLAAINDSQAKAAEGTYQPLPDARLSMRAYIKAVNHNWSKVLEAVQESPDHKHVLLFMLTDLEQLRQDTINHFYTYSKRVNLDLDQTLGNEDMALVPSNFCLTEGNPFGEEPKLDPESAGLNDSAKVMSDLFFNLKRTLSDDDKVAIMTKFSEQRPQDVNFQKRFIAVCDLVYVEHVLDILKELLPQHVAKLRESNPSFDANAHVTEKLELAKELRQDFEAIEHICHIDQLIDGDPEV